MFKKMFLASFVLFFMMMSVGESQAVLVKLATVAPEGSLWMEGMRRGAEEIRKRTEGRVQIKLFGGGVMGNENSVLRKIRIGQLQGGAFTAGGLSNVCPDLRLYGLPMVFHSFDEVDHVRARMDKVLVGEMEKAGFVSFGFGEGGFALLMSNEPVRSLKDMKGKKVWIPTDDRISEVAMKHLGLSPVVLPITDVLTGLQTGLLDIVATSPIGAISFQWHVKTRYITDAPLAYIFATLVIDKRVFDKLEPGDQNILQEVMTRIYQEFDRQNRADNQAALEALVKQGLQVVKPDDEELALWRRKAEEVNLGLEQEGAFAPARYRELQGHLADFREK
ncbi:MAG: TRAP transporter substrate-binding protein DctP [Desulfuromonadaceae bacterium]|nr:TRAP transporter substrate-binding protein DctP [Desulfuromonadaceae bacterium]